MRRILSLAIATLALAACQDTVAPTTDAAPALSQGIPEAPTDVMGIQALSASISGPGSVGNYTTCTFTSNVSGGTPPFTYSWGIAGASGGYLSLGSYNTASVSATGYYYGSYGGTGSVYLTLTVTDANGLTASPYKLVSIPYSSTSC